MPTRLITMFQSHSLPLSFVGDAYGSLARSRAGGVTVATEVPLGFGDNDPRGQSTLLTS